MGFLLLGALTLSLFAADDAAAQSPAASVYYKAYPSDLVSITADNKIIVLQQPSAGMMTATVVGTSFILSNGEYIQNPLLAPGMTLITMNFITSCSVRNGCPAFGLNGLANAVARAAAFRAMDLDTMRQFAASGADPNERPIRTNASGYLLFILAEETIPDGEAHPRLAQMSVLIEAGANVNATVGLTEDSNGRSILHLAASASSTDEVPALLAMPGISVNILDANGETPLDQLADLPAFFLSDENRENARLLREAGGRCIIHSGALCNN